MSVKKITGYAYILSALLLWTAAVLPLTALDPESPVNHYLLDQWGLDKGFLPDTVFSIAQTPDGYLWLGTEKGLIRYDGIKFKPFRIGRSSSGLERWVGGLLVDREGTLWISGGQGLTQYKDGRFKTFTTKDGLSGNNTMALAEDSFGNLWIGTYRNYLNRFKDGRFTVFDSSDGLDARQVNNIWEDGNGVLWISSYTTGVFYGQNENFRKYDLEAVCGNCNVRIIYGDRKNVLWIGTTNGLVRIENPLEKNKRVMLYDDRNGLSDNAVWSIREDNHDNLWVGTWRSLHRLKKGTDGRLSIDRLPLETGISVLFEDREKSLWIGTFRFGLKRLRDGAVKTMFRPESIPPYRMTLFKDRNRRIWLGSFFGELFQYRDGAFHKTMETRNDTGMGVTAISEDRLGNLWIGAASRGVFQVKDGQFISKYPPKPDQAAYQVNVILWDSRGILRFGTRGGGLHCVENGVLKNYTTADGLPHDNVSAIYEDSKQNVWVGTGNGVTRLARGKWEPDMMTAFLPGLRITSIYEDNDGVFWFGTLGSGLVRFDDGKPHHYTTENGLRSNSIFQMLEDRRGNVWLCSLDGILKAPKHELTDVAAGRAAKVNCISFGLSDGMLSVRCVMSSQNGAVETPGGDFWIATQKGVAVVKPARISINKSPPPVVIEAAFFNGAPVSLSNSGNIFKGIKNIRFQFTTPTFISTGKVNMYYKLEGHDLQWNTVETFRERTAFYKDLPPGKYRFRVTASNSDGVRNPTGAAFDFTLNRYFHETTAFKLGVLLLSLLAVWTGVFSIKRYLYLKKLKDKYKHSTLDPEKAEVALKKLKYLLEVKKIFKDENLSLKTLAAKLVIPPRYLSQVMNERLNKSFWDIVNGYRVEEAKKMLSDPQKTGSSILEIAFEVGFSSKEAFNRAFKKYVDMTPTEFKKTG